MALELLRAARPRQWIKNLLVVAAPAAAGVILQPEVAWPVAVAFAAFCLAASGTYLINDAVDAPADRHHPTKRHRPIAAGTVTRATGASVGAVLLVSGILATVPVRSLALTATLVTYVALTVAYSVWLRHVTVVDIVVVAAGYFLRAIAGGFAAAVPLSEWFLIVTWFGALLLVSGKRHAEHLRLEDTAEAYRPVLEGYPPRFTEHVLTVSAAVTVLAYCLWAFETQAAGPGEPWLAISILPFTVVFLRYTQLVLRGEGGDPTTLVLRDAGLITGGLVWAAVLGAGIYGVDLGL